jgi:hypothetical protein
MQGTDAFVCLQSVLNLISVHPVGRIAELTPKGWAVESAPSSADRAG